MQAQSKTFFDHKARLLASTLVLAVAATVAQTASAQPDGGYRGHAMGGAMGMMQPGHIAHVLDSIDATPEQRAQIKQIVQAARTDLQAQHEAGRALRQQSQALFAQPTVDARAAEALRQQMLAQHDQASKRMLQAMLDVSRVLTPEQRKLLSDKMTQRSAMMERHRAERDKLAAPMR